MSEIAGGFGGGRDSLSRMAGGELPGWVKSRTVSSPFSTQ